MQGNRRPPLLGVVTVGAAPKPKVAGSRPVVRLEESPAQAGFLLFATDRTESGNSGVATEVVTARPKYGPGDPLDGVC
jgi:hypothetical protein